MAKVITYKLEEIEKLAKFVGDIPFRYAQPIVTVLNSGQVSDDSPEAEEGDQAEDAS